MYKLGNIDSKNEHYKNKYKNKSESKLNYLTDSSCSEIQKILREDYFYRLQKASLNNLINYVTEDDPNFNTNKQAMNIHLEEMHKKPIKYAAKQILFSDRVRKNNFNRIKKYPRKNILNINESETIPVLKNASMSLLHIPNKKISKKKNKIEQSIRNINSGINDVKISIGNFDLCQTNSTYFVGEIKIEIIKNNLKK